ncbi:TIGR02453 family protein [Dendrosporobacter quercicolus]|uniref:TIGR02453 family protein n=1 Tax=Dendrosporobacter quercicolus TaxID=146817 RepID=A0A1G9TXC5_9FIRM|nr:TIGR02453 family protein [Dendrosporobacter quercicolus]
MIFRLNRDIRFSSDKKPYNPAFRAHLSPWGKPFIPLGYYLCIRPGEQSFVAGGLYGSGWQEAANRVRDYIADHGNEFEKIVTGNAFTKYFTVLGEKLKRVPKGNDIDHPQAEYLKHKSWYAQSFIADKTVLTAERFYDIVIEKYRALKPFKDYLNKALECYQIPKR